jgi:hypothetical protein
MLLSIENYISWRKSNKEIHIRYISGDTAVLSISKNGIDAKAMYINELSKEHIIEAECWFTIEALGIQTELEDNVNCGKITVALEDWRPEPLKHRKSRII